MVELKQGEKNKIEEIMEDKSKKGREGESEEER